MGSDIPVRDGIEWFDDTLQDVACRAAVELDHVRLGRAVGTAHVHVLCAWLAKLDPSFVSAVTVINRAVKSWKPGRPPMSQVSEVQAFAREAAEAILLALSCDPSAHGWTRLDAIHFCIELSKYAGISDYFGRMGRGGQWRC